MNKTKYLSVFLISIIIILIGFSVWCLIKINKGLQGVFDEKSFIASNKNIDDTDTLIDQQKEDYDYVEKKIDSLFIEKTKIVEFIETLEKIAQENKVTVTITGVDQQQGTKEDLLEYGTLCMFVSASGEFNDISGFLNAVENLPYAIFVTNTKLIKNVEVANSTEKLWSINFSLEVITN
jgi:Tfp pilus assembly protein PilO